MTNPPADDIRAALAAIHKVPLQPKLIIHPRMMRQLRLLRRDGESLYDAAIRLGAEGVNRDEGAA